MLKKITKIWYAGNYCTTIIIFFMSRIKRPEKSSIFIIILNTKIKKITDKLNYNIFVSLWILIYIGSNKYLVQLVRVYNDNDSILRIPWSITATIINSFLQNTRWCHITRWWLMSLDDIIKINICKQNIVWVENRYNSYANIVLNP